MVEQATPRKTIQFNMAQWRDVILGDVARLHETIKGAQGPFDEAGMVAIKTHVDNLMAMIGAWSLTAQQAMARQEELAKAAQAAAAPPEPIAVPQTNGAHVQEAQVAPIPKKKGGWPAGKKRGARKGKGAQVSQ